MKLYKSLLKSLLEKLFFLYAKRVFSNRVFSLYSKKICKQEFENQKFIALNERSVEYRFVFQHLSQICPINILDVGTGETALPHLMRTCGFVVTAIDNVRDYWTNSMLNRHFHIIDDDITKTQLTQQFDIITCISVLEHIKNYNAAVKSMFSLLKSEGYLLITFPYNENYYVENVYMLPGSNAKGKKFPFITQAFSRNELDNWLTLNRGKILEQEYWRFFSGEYWTVGERILPPLRVGKDEKHQLTCILIQKK